MFGDNLKSNSVQQNIGMQMSVLAENINKAKTNNGFELHLKEDLMRVARPAIVARTASHIRNP